MRKARTKYRRFSYLSDWRGMKSAIGELRGLGYPQQPRLNVDYEDGGSALVFDEAWFIRTIKDKLANHPDNAMEYPFEGERIFDEPLVGFARGDDPLFERYKEIIGPHHFTPAEMMAWQAELNGAPAPKAGDLSVVSFVMPVTKVTRNENASRDKWLSERWAQTRLLGEIFSQTFVREIVADLMSKGVLAISPDVTPRFAKKRYPACGWGSPWSHRHMAYAAGLGTFGMHDFFITEAGAAHRCGSFIVNLKLKPNRERQADFRAYCLHAQGVKCLKCAARCPVNAVSENGHDKEKCYQRVAKTIRYCNNNYHIFIYGCGLCSVKVPCETGIPKAILRKMRQSA